mmetsp:Transcript_68577/g.146736  ORF Transcript_68577/g.146736 Transcript_68577/m.146736 type:complete len:879 (+) Transcript_68577:73-2709(+)
MEQEGAPEEKEVEEQEGTQEAEEEKEAEQETEQEAPAAAQQGQQAASAAAAEEDFENVEGDITKADELVMQAQEDLLEDLDHKHKEALEQAQEARSIYRKHKNSMGEADALRVLIEVKLLDAGSKKPTQALELAEKELERFRKKKDEFGEASMLLSLALINMDKRGSANREKGLQQAKDAMTIFQELGDRKMEAVATKQLVDILIKQCDRGLGPVVAKQAQRYAKDNRHLYAELEDSLGEAASFHQEAMAAWYMEQPWKDGLKLATMALDLYKVSNKKRKEAIVHYTIAEWANRSGMGEDGKKHAKKAQNLYAELIEAAEEIGANDDCIHVLESWRIGSCNMLVSAYLNLGEKKKALDLQQKEIEFRAEQVEKYTAQNLQVPQRYKAMEVQSKDMLAAVYLDMGDTDNAMTQAQDALGKCGYGGGDGEEDSKLEMEADLLIASIYEKDEEYKDAIQAYKDAQISATDLGDTRVQARTMASLVALYMKSGDLEKARDQAKQAKQMFRNARDLDGEASVLLNEAMICLSFEELEKADDNAKEALTIYEDLEYRLMQASALLVHHMILSHREKHDAALEQAKRARELLKKLDNRKMDECIALCRISESNFALANREADEGAEPKKSKQKWTEALKAAKEALSIAKTPTVQKKDPKKKLLSDTYFFVAQAMGMMGKVKEALEKVGEGRECALEAANKEGVAYAEILEAQINMWNGKDAEAKVAIQKALKLAATLKNPETDVLGLAQMVLNQLEPQQASEAQFEAAMATGAQPGLGALPAGSMQGAYRGPSKDKLADEVKGLALGILGSEAVVEMDEKLADIGLDSLAMVQFRNKLSAKFKGIVVTASLIFDYPTINEVSGYIMSELAQEAKRQGELEAPLLK